MRSHVYVTDENGDPVSWVGGFSTEAAAQEWVSTRDGSFLVSDEQPGELPYYLKDQVEASWGE